MSKWLSKFLEKKYQNEPDKPDKCSFPLSLSDRSKEIFNKKVKNIPLNEPDKPDKSDLSGLSGNSKGLIFDFHPQLVGLSVPSEGIFNKKTKNIPQNLTDKPDKTHLSGLSDSSGGIFNKNVENISENRTDKTGKANGNGHLSVLSGPIYDSFVEHSILDAFEERIAIAEYDGQQNSDQAQWIAYQDAFIATLNALPYEEREEEDWFDQRIKAAKEWLASQDIRQTEYKITEH